MIKNYKEIFFNTPVIECDDVILRRHIPADAKAILQYGRDEETLKYLDWIGADNIEDAKASIYDHFWSNPCAYAIALKDTNLCIGAIDIRPEYSNDKATFGYVLDRAYWGRGYMSQALSAMLDMCFNQIEINKIEAGHYDDNYGSGRVMEKCGMKKEGVSPQHKIVKGKYVDVITYGILKKDYIQSQKGEQN